MLLVIASNIVPPEGIIIPVRLMNPLEDINPFFDSLTTPISSPRAKNAPSYDTNLLIDHPLTPFTC